MQNKPRAFIGSSSEGKRHAQALQVGLEPEVECVVWDQNALQLSLSVFEALSSVKEQYDFGIFVLSADDMLKMRGQEYMVARDNIIFEIGLFVGSLGGARTLLVTPMSSGEFHLPSDLAGVLTAKFDPQRKDIVAALGSAALRLKEHMLQIGSRPARVVSKAGSGSSDYVAAVCFEFSGDSHKFLLVKSTEGRRIFPKGKLKLGEDINTSALRYAHDEGHINGRAFDVEPHLFKYYKEMETEEQNIAAALIVKTSSVRRQASFREPAWFDPEDAETELISGRTYKYSSELRKVLAWANLNIKRIREPRIQSAILPYRIKKDTLEILLITSRTNRNWVIPKGNIKSGMSSEESAAEEAMEEAGIKGDQVEALIGTYSYSRYTAIDYRVEVYPMKVTFLYEDWKEKNQRERCWVNCDKAATMVNDEYLKQIIIDFRKKFKKKNNKP